MSADVNTLSAEEAAELLAAGAILPPGAASAGERTVALTARAYRHPGLDDRVVVRLTPGELGAAEDAAAGFLGLVLDGEPAEVGLGLRQSLGFPEWILVHHPEDGHQALALLPELERASKQAKSRPKMALQTYQGIADRLAASLPHFLPTFHEQVGRVFLAVENPTFAAQQFTKARRAESAHGLDIDESRLDDVFLEFALAGALPAKALVGYGKALSARVPAPEALHRYARLCARRTAGGLTPSAQLATELRRLAKLSGADAAAVERDYLAGIVTLPATLGAPEGWWKSHRAAVVDLLRQDPAMRRALLDTMPTADDGKMPQLWLAILTEAGVLDAFHDDAPDDAAEEAVLPEDGAVGWLKRFLAWRNSGWRSRGDRLPELYALIERCAGRLHGELAGAGQALSSDDDLDMLDLLLALKIPVADPGPGLALPLERWVSGDGQRDLAAIEADPRFRPAFFRGANNFSAHDASRRAIRKLISLPGGRVMLAEWVAKVASDFSATGLPGLPQAMQRLEWLPGEALALAEAEVRAAAATDLAPVLARTLRAGLLDEFAWPAWEEAVTELVGKDVENLVVADAWPYLVVAGPTQVRVLGADGPVLTHDLRIPAKDAYELPGFHYVDGELLVHWRSRHLDGRVRGYWHHTPDQLLSLEQPNNATRGLRMYYYGPARLDRSLALADGARTTGHAPLRRGDTAVPLDSAVMTDGHSYWTWTWDGSDHSSQGWYEFDPATGARGRKSVPAFLADALKTAPAGAEFVNGRMLTAGSDEAGPSERPVDGVIGFRVVRLPDGSLRGEDLAGVTVTIPRNLGDLSRAILFPGDDTPRALVASGTYDIRLVDADGIVVAEAKTDGRPGAYAKGTAILPPATFWQYLRPRDPQTSEILRRLDLETAAALVAAGHKADGDVPAAEAKAARRARIMELIPGLTEGPLLSGVNGVVRQAAQQQGGLDKVADRLERALTQGLEAAETEIAGPGDRLIGDALGGMTPTGYTSRWRDVSPALFGILKTMGRELHDPPVRKRPILVHTEGPMLPSSTLWEAVLKVGPGAAVRMVSPFTDPQHQEAVRALLAELDALGLADAGESSPWRRFKARAPRTQVTPSDEHRPTWLGVLPQPDGAFATFLSLEWQNDDVEFSGLMYDPNGRFELPAPYKNVKVKNLRRVGEDGWLKAFLAEAGTRGPAPWFPAAADAFAELTGVTAATARLVVAGLPRFDRHERSFLTPSQCKELGLKAAEAAVARDRLVALDNAVRVELVSALLPADPARLWTDGPDVAAAAEVWNRAVGRRIAVPELLSGEARRAVVRTGWDVLDALPALLDPQGTPELGADLAWAIQGDRARPTDDQARGFSVRALNGTVPLAAWLAHRLPAGDPIRAALPAALAAVRERLAAPGMMIDLERYVNLPEFRKTAGPAAEAGKGYERYGAVVMATHDNQPAPALLVGLLDSVGGDPFLPALRGEEQRPFPAEIGLRLVRDARFEALLADPGDPAAGNRDADGTWAPQDPTRSVPELVTEVAKDLGVSEDAAAVYLMLLAMPDPTDRNTARWTGWKPARLKAAREELARTDAVVEAVRPRAGRKLFLPGGWVDIRTPHLPLEAWKLPFFADLLHHQSALIGVLVPVEPAADLYRRAWQRIQDGDRPRFEELRTARRGRRR